MVTDQKRGESKPRSPSPRSAHRCPRSGCLVQKFPVDSIRASANQAVVETKRLAGVTNPLLCCSRSFRRVEGARDNPHTVKAIAIGQLEAHFSAVHAQIPRKANGLAA